LKDKYQEIQKIQKSRLSKYQNIQETQIFSKYPNIGNPGNTNIQNIRLPGTLGNTNIQEIDYIWVFWKLKYPNTRKSRKHKYQEYPITRKSVEYKCSIKELSLCNKLWFSNPYIFSTQCSRPLIFQTMKYVRLNNPSLKYQRFTPTSSRDIGIGTFEFVAKTQILYCKVLQEKYLI